MVMTMKTTKKLIAVTCLMLCFALLLTSIYASASPPETGGKLSVVVTYNGSALSGVPVNIYRVAAIEIVSGKVMIVPRGDFEGVVEPWSGVPDVNTIKSIVSLFETHIRSNAIEPLKSGATVGDRVVFEDLEIGLYLYTQGGAAPGGYTFTSALVVVNGDVEYEVKPKTQAPPYEPPPTTPPTIPRQEDEEEEPGEEEPPDDVELTEPDVPLDQFPPDGDLPQTGITNWDVLIILLASLGVILVLLGLLNMKRSRKRKEEQ